MRIGVLGAEQGLARHLHGAGIEVLVHGAGEADPAALKADGLACVDDWQAFFVELEHPRLFLLDLPLGPAIDRTIDAAYVVMEPGDVVIDPSGSYWGDTLRRFRRMRHRSLFYVDAALIGPLPGVTVLASGDERGVELAMPLLVAMAGEGGVVRAGGAAAAHYALMVRDAVATSMAQAVSEARQLLEAYPNDADGEAIAGGLWPDGLAPGVRSGWLLDDAVRLEAAVPLLAQAVMLELGGALDEHRSTPPAPRVGGFVHPDDML